MFVANKTQNFLLSLLIFVAKNRTLKDFVRPFGLWVRLCTALSHVV